MFGLGCHGMEDTPDPRYWHSLRTGGSGDMSPNKTGPYLQSSYRELVAGIFYPDRYSSWQFLPRHDIGAVPHSQQGPSVCGGAKVK